MYGKTTNITIIDLQDLPIKLKPHHIIYMEKDYDVEINLYIQSHYYEMRNYFKEQGYDFCYFPRMTEDELRQLIKEEFIPKGNIPFGSIGIRSTFIYEFISDSDKDSILIPNSSLFFCVKDPNEDPHSVPVYRLLSLDFGSQWYFKIDFSNLLDDIKSYLLNDPENSYYYDSDEELATHSFDDEVYIEPDFDNYDPFEELFEMSLDLDEGTHRHEIATLREEVEQQVRRLNNLGHSGIYYYELERYYNEEGVFSFMTINKDFSISLDAVDEEITFDLDPIHKAVYLLFLLHPEGISYDEFGNYKDELTSIYKRLKPLSSFKTSDAGENTLENMFEVDGKVRPALTQRISRIKKIIEDAIGNERIASNYIIRKGRGDLRVITVPRKSLLWAVKL